MEEIKFSKSQKVPHKISKVLNEKIERHFKNRGFVIEIIELDNSDCGTINQIHEIEGEKYHQIGLTKIGIDSKARAQVINVSDPHIRNLIGFEEPYIEEEIINMLEEQVFANDLELQIFFNKELTKYLKTQSLNVYKKMVVESVMPIKTIYDKNGVEFQQIGFGIMDNRKKNLVAPCLSILPASELVTSITK